MELILFFGAIALLLILATLVFLFLSIFKTLIREQKMEREMNQNQIRLILESQSQSDLISLLGKTVSLLSVKDPLSFQAVQAMDSDSRAIVEPRDNSGQGEYLQWVDENEELTPAEKELLSEVNYDG